MAEFNLTDLYSRTFGYIAAPHRGVNQNVSLMASEEYTAEAEDKAVHEKSLLGTPFLAPISIGGFKIPNEAVITIVGQRNIVTTDFDGAKGSFKEEYSIDDYKITIKGILTNTDFSQEKYPEEDVRRLQSICKESGHKKIINKICEIHGINYIAIERWEFPGVPGEPEMQAYIIEALSDYPFDFDLIS